MNTEIIDKIAEQFGVVIDWTADNVLPYFEDLMHRWANVEILSSVAIIVAVLGLSFIAFFWLYRHKDNATDFDTRMALGVLVVFLVIIDCLLCYGQGLDIIRCIYTPEIEFVKYLTSVMGA